VLQSANNLAQSQKSGKADDKKKNVEYASAAWKQIIAKYQVCAVLFPQVLMSWIFFVLFQGLESLLKVLEVYLGSY